MTIKNLNPIDIQVLFFIEKPLDWTQEAPGFLLMRKGETKTFNIKMKSNTTTEEGTYNLMLTAYNDELKISDRFPFVYIVSSSQIPTVAIAPTAQEAVRGTTVECAVTITNNDPTIFASTTFSVSAAAPYGWKYDASPKSQVIKPQQSKNFILKVTSNMTPALSNRIPVNVSNPYVSISVSAIYNAVYCGDRVCQSGEETSCSKDCPSSHFICARGRCEQTTDNGVSIFSSALNIAPDRMVVCN